MKCINCEHYNFIEGWCEFHNCATFEDDYCLFYEEMVF